MALEHELTVRFIRYTLAVRTALEPVCLSFCNKGRTKSVKWLSTVTCWWLWFVSKYVVCVCVGGGAVMFN